MKDLSDAKYFIYVNRKGFSFGWHFLAGGALSDVDGLREFDCGEYGKAYVALNAEYNIQKILFEDGREPSILENTNYPIAEESKQIIHFYNKDGDLIEPFTIKLID